MSVIQIQATRGSTKPEAPNRDLYEDKSLSRVSKVPFYIGASLSALILYFKNSVVPIAQAHEGLSEEQAHLTKSHSQQQHVSPIVDIQDADLKKVCLPGNFGTPAEAATHLPHLLKHGSAFLLPMNAGIGMNMSDIRADSAEANFRPTPDMTAAYSGNPKGVFAFPTNDNRLGPSSAGSGGVASGNSTGSSSSSGSGASSNSGSDSSGGSSAGSSTTSGTKTPTSATKTNHAPTVTGNVQLPDAFSGDIISILVASLLKNVVDVDGDKLSATDVKINGTSLHLVNDHYIYDGNDVGFVTVTYNVTDGKAAVADKAIVDFLPRPPILGTDGKDTLLGTAHGDNINAGAGDDTIHGQAGDDVIYAGNGDDTVTGDAGNDVIYGGDGNDTLYGGDGNDTIFGGNGDDVIYGGSGDNFLFGGSGNDIIHAGDGKDNVFGGSGRDWIFDGAGSDKIFGGIGNDTIYAIADGANDYFDGGSGVNQLSYASFTGSLDINLNTGIATGSGIGLSIGVDSFTNFQVIKGGSGGTVFHAKVNVEPSVPHDLAATSPSNHEDTVPPVTAPSVTTSIESGGSLADPSPTNTGITAHHELSPMIAMPEQQHDDISQAAGLLLNTNDTIDAVADLPDAAVNQGYTYLGGAGVDTLDYSPAQQGLTIDVAHGMAHGQEIGTDYFSSIENFITGAGDDTFVGAGTGAAHHMTVTDAPDEPDLAAGPFAPSPGTGNTNLMLLDDTSGDKVTGAEADQHFDGGAGFDSLNYSKATHALQINVVAGTATGDDIGHDTFANIEHFVGGAGNDLFTVGAGTYVLDGEGGANTFVFSMPDPGNQTHAEIRGFEVGDLIQVSKFDIYEKPANAEDDQFQKIYANNTDDNADPTVQDAVAPIRVRHEIIHDVQLTMVDGNLDDQGNYQTSIELDGYHHLVVNNHLV